MAYTFFNTYTVNGKNIYSKTLSNYTFGVDVYTEQSNAVNNYSNVKFVAWVRCDGGTTTSSTYSFKQDGTTYQSLYIKLGVQDDAGYAVPKHANEKIVKYYHNQDGTKSITFNFSVETEMREGANSNLNNYCFKSASITQTITLPTINRLSPFNFEGGNSLTMGSSKTIKISPYVSSFRHNIEVYFGSYKEVVASNIETSYTWIPSKDLGHQIPNSTSGVGTLYVHTYNSGTYIGTESKTFTLWVSGDMYPTFSYTCTNNDDFNGLLLTTMSSVNFEIQNATGSYGSTIKSYSISGEGLNVSESSGTSEVFQNNGACTYTLKVTDSRGRTATQTKSINVYRYAQPSINMTIRRCDQYDTPSDVGNYVLIDVSYAIVNPNYANQNAKHLTIEYKATDDEYYETFFDGELGDYTSEETYTSSTITFDSSKSYDFKATITDSFNSTEATGFIATSTCILDVEPLGVGIGKYHQQGALDIKGDFYLNDKKFYESGTFNPSFYCGSGSSMVFNRREATYQKVGEYCTFNISLQVEHFNIGDTTAQLEVIDLPFVNQGTYSAVNIGYCKGISFTGNVYDLRCYIRPQESKIVFVVTDLTTGNVGTIKGSHCASLLDIQLSGSYKVE